METHNQKAVPSSMPNTNDTKLDLPQCAIIVDNTEDRIEIRNHNTTNIQSTQPRITFLPSSFYLLLKNKGKKRKFTKADISNPTNFEHISTGFGTETDQPVPPSKPCRQTELPQNGTSQRLATSPPPARPTPPPVPTIPPRRRLPQLPSSLPPGQKIVSVLAAVGRLSEKPPPPPPIPSVTTVSTGTAAVNFNTLKPPAPAVPILNDTSALMDSIRNGITLKKVDKTTVSIGSGAKTQKSNIGSGNKNLADAILEVLVLRGDVIQHSDDESNQSSDNDSVWE